MNQKQKLHLASQRDLETVRAISLLKKYYAFPFNYGHWVDRGKISALLSRITKKIEEFLAKGIR